MRTMLVLLVAFASALLVPAGTGASQSVPGPLLVAETPAFCPDCVRGPWQFSRDSGEPLIQQTTFEVLPGEYELLASDSSGAGGATVSVNGKPVMLLGGPPGRVTRVRLALRGHVTLAVAFPLPGSARLSLRAIETTTLKSCGPARNRTLFDSPLVDPGQIRYVTPLGYRVPPNHTLPIHHINPNTFLDVDGHRTEIPVSAPGLVRVVAAVFEGVGAGGVPDYSVFLRPCEEVRMYLLHINGLSPRLQALTGDPAGWGAFGEILTAIDVSAGEPIGVSRGFDIGLVDTRQPALGFVTRSWYEFTGTIPPGLGRVLREIAPERLFQFCALDYFTPAVADPLVALLASPDGTRRTASPLCGRHMLDVAGTAQGGWFGSDDLGTAMIPPDGAFDESNDFSFAPDVDPSIFSFAFSTEVIPPPDGIPGLITQASYAPVLSAGLVNRAPAGVLRNAGVYCFQNLIYRGIPGPGRLLVSVESTPPPDVERIRILYQAAPSVCGTGPWIVGPAAKIYRR